MNFQSNNYSDAREQLHVESDVSKEVDEKDSDASPGQSPLYTLLGGHGQYFGGLAVAPLATLSKKLSQSGLSAEDVMKLRSIMRFSIEYHNPLVVYSEQLPPSSLAKQYTEAASECFNILYQIITVISGDRVNNHQVSALYDDFRRVERKLAKLEGPAKQEVEGICLKQSITAVHGQMKDFISLVDGSFNPSSSC